MDDKASKSKGPVEPEPATSLLRDLFVLNEEFSKSVGDRLSVNPTDFSAMEHLIENGPMTAGELANAVGISPGAATVMIDRLVELGHVTREVNPNDRRGIVVSPNPKSVSAAWTHIMPVILASEKLLSQMSAAERVAVEKYLAGMIKAYQKSM